MGLDLVIHTYRKQQSTALDQATSHTGQMRMTTNTVIIKERMWPILFLMLFHADSNSKR